MEKLRLPVVILVATLALSSCGPSDDGVEPMDASLEIILLDQMHLNQLTQLISNYTTFEEARAFLFASNYQFVAESTVDDGKLKTTYKMPHVFPNRFVSLIHDSDELVSVSLSARRSEVNADNIRDKALVSIDSGGKASTQFFLLGEIKVPATSSEESIKVRVFFGEEDNAPDGSGPAHATLTLTSVSPP